ncbi:MAG TPA: SDR family NAD(P)-dependent oxidoreductase [Xanthobacteraceae bacterium]|jgi:short-subunit dehydrogenase
MPRHVVITGASSGMGAALAKLYGIPGTRLSLFARDSDRLETVAAGCRSNGCDVEVHAADVTDAAAMERLLLACDSLVPVDLVIANAGIGGAAVLAGKAAETGDLARRIISVNTLGVINTVAPLLPRLVGRGAGQIAIVSSLLAFFGVPACPAYSASKAATWIYGDALRRLLAPHGVRVTIVYPGFVDTPMSQSLGFRGLLVWSADRAALHIANGLARGRREMLFPWPLALVVRGIRGLPTALADLLLTQLHLAWVKSNARSRRGLEGR